MKSVVDEDPEINVDSLWIIGPRAKGGKRENSYHGNFVPQIPSDFIRRFTKEGDIVLEPFAGSGTTLFECERLKRRYIGFDINVDIVNAVKAKLDGQNSGLRLHIHDASSKQAGNIVEKDLSEYARPSADLLIVHPPYFDIIKFTDKPCDLSNAATIDDFLRRYVDVLKRMVPYVRDNGHIALVVGDLYRNSEVIPLGFMLMEATLANFSCKLKGIIIKDMVGNRAKIGLNSLWRARALRSDYYLFKHEYIFAFRKVQSKRLRNREGGS